jgi:hypothetical protein
MISRTPGVAGGHLGCLLHARGGMVKPQRAGTPPCLLTQTRLASNTGLEKQDHESDKTAVVAPGLG